MSTARRAYDMLRGYVNREWERLQTVAEVDAERELRESMDMPYMPARPTPEPAPPDPATSRQQACQILGVEATATFAEIRASFTKLNRRSDPANFPAGSYESMQAADIQRRVQWAYNLLSEGMDATDRRFGSLEID